MVTPMRHSVLKRKDLFWLALMVLMALLPTLSEVTANSFLMHVLILILLFASMAQAWHIIGGYG